MLVREMNKKIISLTIVSFLLFTSILLPTTISKESTADEDSGVIQSDIEFENEGEINKPLSVNSTQSIDIKIKYKLNIGNFEKWFFFKRRIGRAVMFGSEYFLKIKQLPKAVVNLSVIEKPDYCTAELDKNTVEFDFNNVFEENNFVLTFKINDSEAPALKESEIIIKADFKYNGSGLIATSSNTTSISFRPKYNSSIDINLSKEEEITPLKETTIPINITNIGNGDTIVDIIIKDIPEGWNASVYPEELTIDVGKTADPVDLVFMSTKDFEEEKINLTFSPRSVEIDDVEDKYLIGENLTVSISFVNDGSLKEENDDDGIDITLVIIVVVVMLVLIAIFSLILKRRG